MVTLRMLRIRCGRGELAVFDPFRRPVVVDFLHEIATRAVQAKCGQARRLLVFGGREHGV
jgi:hypothetical protein